MHGFFWVFLIAAGNRARHAPRLLMPSRGVERRVADVVPADQSRAAGGRPLTSGTEVKRGCAERPGGTDARERGGRAKGRQGAHAAITRRT
jgi:hypothetical protein